MYPIISINVDVASKWIVRVMIDTDNTAFFKFDTEPTQELIDSTVEEYLVNLKRANDIDAQVKNDVT